MEENFLVTENLASPSKFVTEGPKKPAGSASSPPADEGLSLRGPIAINRQSSGKYLTTGEADFTFVGFLTGFRGHTRTEKIRFSIETEAHPKELILSALLGFAIYSGKESSAGKEAAE